MKQDSYVASASLGGSSSDSSKPPGGKWVLVPAEPTEEMLDACIPLSLDMAYRVHQSTPDWGDGYRAMIAAAPSPPSDGTKAPVAPPSAVSAEANYNDQIARDTARHLSALGCSTRMGTRAAEDMMASEIASALSSLIAERDRLEFALMAEQRGSGELRFTLDTALAEVAELKERIAELEKELRFSVELAASEGKFHEAAQSHLSLAIKALERIARWHGEFPETGKTWPSGEPMSYGAAYGSNGERDFMRDLARSTLSALQKEGTGN